jgi:pyruvate,orthophosphate dikinase
MDPEVRMGEVKKYVFSFGSGRAEGSGAMKALLGGKGAGLAEMTNIGLPVPAGFTITTEVCELYYKNNRKYPEHLREEVAEHLVRLETSTGKKFGDPKNPLLVSVRSGAPVSMPGMMETILNLGLNDSTVEGLAKLTGDRHFALDAYRRFVGMYGSTAKDIPSEEFEQAFDEIKDEATRKRLGTGAGKRIQDNQVNADELALLIPKLKAIYRKHTGEDFPQDPQVQLWGAITAVFESWMAPKAVTYREVEKITDIAGTAVSVVQMVFGNLADRSGTGVCFTRDPNKGDNSFYGDYLPNAQGEDVVAGVRTPMTLSEFERTEPEAYGQLVEVRRRLENHYRDMQDLEFTVEQGKLYMLQCRTGKRSPSAAFHIAVDMVKEGLISKAEAVLRIRDKDIEGIFYPVIDPSKKPELKKAWLVQGIDAVPGAAAGKVVFTAKDAELWAARGENVILVRKETSPEDVGGMHSAKGILTATGGKTSHAAVVARGWGKCCIVGCEALEVDYEDKLFHVGSAVVREGEEITLNGSTGDVYRGSLPLIQAVPPESFETLMSWADAFRSLEVRANVDTPYDAAKARELGAQGVGLCRTEHMFFDSEERILAIRRMIVATSPQERQTALDALLPVQREDFAGIFRAMHDLPVTIRLLDPPLHEFVPHDEAGQRGLAKATGKSFESIRAQIDRLHEQNPMLGHRGCRLCITFPEILDMQVRAIIEAALVCVKEGLKVEPEIMHPLVIDRREFAFLEARTRKVADELIQKSGLKLDYKVGAMIETPRAALLSEGIADKAEFFSFGTNDLTQMTLGISRDDAGRFLPDYVDEHRAAIFRHDPFYTLDQEGVGKLMTMAIDQGRRVRPKLKVGICGEHGGELESVKFCHKLGMNYVSCSPYRVPIARLAAGQAAIPHP